MRIVSRSESPSFPPLEALLPMEKSWALEVEREEEEPSCVRSGKNELPGRGIECVKQIESSWVSRKRFNSGNKEVSHRSCEREYELDSKRASRSSDSKPHRNDKHSDASSYSEETKGAWRYTSSSRCYPPPSVHIRTSEFSVAEDRRASELRTRSGSLHETRKSIKPNRTSNSFACCRQHLTRSHNGISRETHAVQPSANMVERRQDHFTYPNHRAEMTIVYEASEKERGHADDLLHIQDHQELDEYKCEFQSSFDKHSQYGHHQYFFKDGLSEHRSRHRYVKKMGHQGPCHGVTDWKNAKKCGRSIESEMNLHKAILTEQSFKEKPGATNDEGVASEVVITTENALPEGPSKLESGCTEESEVKNDDSVVAKEQYEMLACLLFDDLQGMDKDFDVTVEVEGPDCECIASIFDDELEETSMDIDAVTEEKEDMSGKAPAVCLTKYPRKASAVKSSASENTKKSHNACSSSSLGLKQSPLVLVDVTNKFEIYASPGVKGDLQEDDAHRLSQRQRQIDFGKNTLGYERYSELIPRMKRKAKDPQTPNPKQVCSKRSWDGQIRKWRRLLHFYDPPSEDGEEIAEDFSILKLHRSNLEERVPDAKEDTRLAEAAESKGCIVAIDRKIVEDANLTIYDDWMES